MPYRCPKTLTSILTMISQNFQFLLFATEPHIIFPSLSAGISGLIIDWENKGKEERQTGFDTQINQDTPDTLYRVRTQTDALIICRLNRVGDIQAGREEITMALQGGANEILLPMVKTVAEVEAVLNYVQGRCGVGVLIETQDAVKLAKEFGKMPLSRVYVGLNDLAIDRNQRNIFAAVADGTVEKIRQYITVPFGFAGLTLPDGGYPIPASLLYSEMARLQCSFTFLRRSFLRDTHGKNLFVEIPQMRQFIQQAFQLPQTTLVEHRDQLKRVIQNSSFFW